jgi:hypothetical protein
MLVFVAANLNAATPGAVRSNERPAGVHPNATGTATVQVVAIGSSALFLELGQASANSQGCSWTAAKGTVIAYDSRVGAAPGTAENGATWITWTPIGGTCAIGATIPAGSNTNINVEMNTDSVIGNRCYFASPRCTIDVPAAQIGVNGQNSLTGFTDTALPQAIQVALNGQSFNTAATDIRPEDAKFASERLFTPCGTPVVTGSQYLGLGYQTGTAGVGTTIKESPLSGSGTFHVFDFNLMGSDPITSAALPGTYTVTQVGAVPIVVFVNPSDEAGFGSLLVSNVNRAVLAGFLDGTYGRTSDIITQTAAGGSSGVASTVFVREPLSGTYNTMEYAVPDSVELKSGQDLGQAAVSANGGTSGTTVPAAYCNGSTWSSTMNPLVETASSLGRSVSSSNANPGRYRSIGTGDEVAAVLANQDSLGYAFWSAANFTKATATTGKYLTVDGVDPIQQAWVDGLIPTSGNELLGNVTMAHVKDGSYPIWSLLRLVSDPALASGSTSPIQQLVTAAANFLTPNQPDFVHASQLTIVRSHFAPPGVTFPCFGSAVGTANGQPANGTGTVLECGGDVGGLVYGIGSDKDYNTDTVSQYGNIGQRQ